MGNRLIENYDIFLHCKFHFDQLPVFILWILHLEYELNCLLEYNIRLLILSHSYRIPQSFEISENNYHKVNVCTFFRHTGSLKYSV